MQIKIFDLGLVEFRKAWEFQKEIHCAVRNNNLSSALILCQHYPVITQGRSLNKKNILISKQELELKGISIYEIERAGDVTYHGPGQITAYPLFNLNLLKKDIHLFLRQLEQVVIELLSDFGVSGFRYPGLTGVWVNNKQKLASIGIAIKNWITFHGVSINIKRDDLDNFRLIRPCGMDIEMTSLESILDREIKMDTLKENLIPKFRGVFTDNRKPHLSAGRGVPDMN